MDYIVDYEMLLLLLMMFCIYVSIVEQNVVTITNDDLNTGVHVEQNGVTITDADMYIGVHSGAECC